MTGNYEFSPLDPSSSGEISRCAPCVQGGRGASTSGDHAATGSGSDIIEISFGPTDYSHVLRFGGYSGGQIGDGSTGGGGASYMANGANGGGYKSDGNPGSYGSGGSGAR